MTNGEAINWLRNLRADIGKIEHQELWHYEQALAEIMEMIDGLTSVQPEEIALHESCTDCPLYDKDRHRCPRFNKVIPETLRELQSAQQ